MFQTVTEEAERADELVLFAFGDICEGVRERFDKFGKNSFTTGVRHGSKADTCDFHYVIEAFIDTLDVLKEFLLVFLSHLTLLCLELRKSFLLIELDSLHDFRHQIEHLDHVLPRDPFLTLKVIEVLNAS